MFSWFVIYFIINVECYPSSLFISNPTGVVVFVAIKLLSSNHLSLHLAMFQLYFCLYFLCLNETLMKNCHKVIIKTILILVFAFSIDELCKFTVVIMINNKCTLKDYCHLYNWFLRVQITFHSIFQDQILYL